MQHKFTTSSVTAKHSIEKNSYSVLYYINPLHDLVCVKQKQKLLAEIPASKDNMQNSSQSHGLPAGSAYGRVDLLFCLTARKHNLALR